MKEKSKEQKSKSMIDQKKSEKKEEDENRLKFCSANCKHKMVDLFCRMRKCL